MHACTGVLMSPHNPNKTMGYEGDAFISYAHLDNVELFEGRKGWVANLQRALEVRVAQLLGSEAHIWWDPKLQGNDVFADTLDRAAAQASRRSSPIVSPRYVKSEWGRRELDRVLQGGRRTGRLTSATRPRVQGAQDAGAAEQHPPELQPLLGYEFFKDRSGHRQGSASSTRSSAPRPSGTSG